MDAKKRIIFIAASVVTIVTLFVVYVFISGAKPTAKPAAKQRIEVTPETLPSSSSPQNQNAQETADKNFSDQVAKIYSQYPWYSKLPIQTDNYFVYFDIKTKRFTAKIYDASNRLSSNDVTQIKNAVTQTLSGFGVNLSTYPIDYKTGL